MHRVKTMTNTFNVGAHPGFTGSTVTKLENFSEVYKNCAASTYVIIFTQTGMLA